VAVPITPVRVGDVVRLKKAHPCGTNEWRITRIGMDIGLECLGCGRKVRLVRYEFDRRFRAFLRRALDQPSLESSPDGQDEGGSGSGPAGEPPAGSESSQGAQ
jgi:hypothetical protein